jgi:hypothetical protein
MAGITEASRCNRHGSRVKTQAESFSPVGLPGTDSNFPPRQAHPLRGLFFALLYGGDCGFVGFGKLFVRCHFFAQRCGEGLYGGS